MWIRNQGENSPNIFPNSTWLLAMIVPFRPLSNGISRIARATGGRRGHHEGRGSGTDSGLGAVARRRAVLERDRERIQRHGTLDPGKQQLWIDQRGQSGNRSLYTGEKREVRV